MTETETEAKVRSRWSFAPFLVTLIVGTVLGFALFFGAFRTGVRIDWPLVSAFLIYAGIGFLGALVFLVVQVLTEEEGGILKRIAKPRYGIPSYLMLGLFLSSGAMVAGLAQASTGVWAVGNIWPTFLIGFGWQGVIAGVAAPSAARARMEEVESLLNEVKNDSVKKLAAIGNSTQTKIQDLNKQLGAATKADPPADDVPMGEVLDEGGAR